MPSASGSFVQYNQLQSSAGYGGLPYAPFINTPENSCNTGSNQFMHGTMPNTNSLAEETESPNYMKL